MLVSRNSGLYSARSSARNEPALRVYRRRLLPLSLSLKARVRVRVRGGGGGVGGYNMGLSVTTAGIPRVFRRELTYIRVSRHDTRARVTRRAASRRGTVPLVSRDAASSRSDLPIPPSFSPNTGVLGGFFPPISRIHCAERQYTGRGEIHVFSFIRLIRRDACHARHIGEACRRQISRRIVAGDSRGYTPCAFSGEKSVEKAKGKRREIIKLIFLSRGKRLTNPSLATELIGIQGIPNGISI